MAAPDPYSATQCMLAYTSHTSKIRITMQKINPPMKYFFNSLAIYIAISILFTGCLTQASQTEQAHSLVEQAHQAFEARQWDSLTPLYAPTFFQDKSPEDWKITLENTTAGLGKLTGVQPTFEQKDPRFGGDFYLYGFLLQYENGSISETLTVYSSIDDDVLKISGHILKTRRNTKS
ncbi:MAG: hypothetical protein CO186_02335 [Zetaproteobacteria bacterium CG_4_9_14_3_um_filter_49_83]|nr:MAG: hypothetical protein COS35_13825 [Zetaproteobacteria bacterium CG02_land_8_20_14_3_00_50_9]PJA36002.1 MAG: hypothetical protein CO186_02335 [Zetaproteobacteria bacterium CG_4_9_14_3_um_filter_49_83]